MGHHGFFRLQGGLNYFKKKFRGVNSLRSILRGVQEVPGKTVN